MYYFVNKMQLQVVDHYGFDRETVTVAISYFDRMLWKSIATNYPTLCHELLAVTSIYLAVKLFERAEKRSYLLRDLVLMSRKKFNKEQIINMESEILSTLSWHVHPTTPQLFSFHFLRVVSRNVAKYAIRNGTTAASLRRFDSSTRKVLEMANFIIELSSFESSLVQERPSAIAAASIRLAIKELKLDDQVLNAICFGHDNNIMIATSQGCAGILSPAQIDCTCLSQNSSSMQINICDMLELGSDLYAVEEKLSNFLQGHTTSLGEINSSL